MTAYDGRMTDHLRRNSNPRKGLTPMTAFYPHHTGVHHRPRRLSQSRERSRPLWRPVATTSPFAFFRPPSFRCPPPSVLPTSSALPSGGRSSTSDHEKQRSAHFDRIRQGSFDGDIDSPITYGKSPTSDRAFFGRGSISVAFQVTSAGWLGARRAPRPEAPAPGSPPVGRRPQPASRCNPLSNHGDFCAVEYGFVRLRPCRHVGIFDPTKLCARYPHSGLSQRITGVPRKPMDASQRINSRLIASEPVPTFPCHVRTHRSARLPRRCTRVDRCAKNRETCHGLPFHATCKTPFRPASVFRISFHHQEIRFGPRVSGASRRLVGIFAPQSNSITRRCSLSPGMSFLAPRVAPSARSDVLRIRRSPSSTSARAGRG